MLVFVIKKSRVWHKLILKVDIFFFFFYIYKVGEREMLKDFFKKKGLKRLAPVMLSGLVGFAGLTAEGAEKPSSKTTSSTVQKTQNTYHLLLKMKAQRQASLVAFMKQELPKYEGSFSHPYFDSKGYLTIGRGLNISTWAEFDKLDFQTKYGKILNREQKAHYFKQLYQLRQRQAKKGFNYKAGYYKNLCAYEATPTSLDRRETQKIYACLSSLERKCRSVGVGFYDLAYEAQYAMLDMEYNLGADGFSTQKFKKFWTLGVAKKDYGKMMAESSRKSIAKERNTAIAEMLQVAGTRQVIPLDSMLQKEAAQRQIALNKTVRNVRL